MNQLRLRIATLCIAVSILSACSREVPGSATVQLKPVSAPISSAAVRQTVYVPVYASIYWGIRQKPVELAATLSVRNKSMKYPLVLESVRYYDSSGKQVREYISEPSELGALATVEFVIQQDDTTGGPGANFLVQWAGAPEMNEPLIEAVMVGQAGTVGISFTSRGEVVKDEGGK